MPSFELAASSNECDDSASKCLHIPPFTIDRHVTKFSGERDDAVVISFTEIPNGLENPVLLQDVVRYALPQLSVAELSTLLDLGSVYVSHIQLPITSGSPLAQLSQRAQRRHASRVKRRGPAGVSPKAPILTHRLSKAQDEAGSVTSLMLPKATVAVRLHLTPQRFPLAPKIQWKNRICFESKLFVIVEKPGGIPCEPVASNYAECVHVQAGRALYGAPLLPLNRIDLWTTGLVCLARCREAVHLHNAWQAEKRLVKTYRLLGFVEGTQNVYELLKFSPNSPCLLENWMPQGASLGLTAPRFVSRVMVPGWKHCVARVVSVAEYHSVPSLADYEGALLGYKATMCRELCRLRSSGFRLYDITVELITGRTHQLRAQFSAAGVSLVCDTMYYPLRGIYADMFSPHRITKELDFSAMVVRRANESSGDSQLCDSSLTKEELYLLDLVLQTKKPTCPIGLQAHSLHLKDHSPLDGTWTRVVAGPPWWDEGLY